MLIAASCIKDDTLTYFTTSLGNFAEGRFVTDQGLTYNITEKTYDGDLSSISRSLITCDILKMVGKNRKEYDIRLRNATNVLEKAPVDTSSSSDEDLYGNDPIKIASLWFSGGYMNLTLQYFSKSGKPVSHEVNLVYEGCQEGVHMFRFRHNANGDIVNGTDTQYWTPTAHVSFPITDILTEDKAEVTVRYSGYKDDAKTPGAETVEKDIKIGYTKTEFIHEQLRRE